MKVNRRLFVKTAFAAAKRILGDDEAVALLNGSKGTPRKGWDKFSRV